VPFELIKPTRGGRGLRGLALSITKHHATLSKELAEDWPENCDFLQILLDRDKKLLGIKPIKKNDSFSITLSKNKKSGSRFFQSKILLKNGLNSGKVLLQFDRKNGIYFGKFPDGSKIKGVLST
jgi:hypothetical protein